MTLPPPYALFVTATNLDAEYINTTLTRAFDGNFQAGWLLWVADSLGSYASCPKLRNDGELARGTEPPLLPRDWSSPFAGKLLQDCARYLLRAPDDVAVLRQCFTVLDEYSREKDEVMVVRIVGGRKGGGEGKGEGEEGDEAELEYFPQRTDTITMEMQTNEGNKFDEKATNYRRICMHEGRLDRSKGPWD